MWFYNWSEAINEVRKIPF